MNEVHSERQDTGRRNASLPIVLCEPVLEETPDGVVQMAVLVPVLFRYHYHCAAPGSHAAHCHGPHSPFRIHAPPRLALRRRRELKAAMPEKTCGASSKNP
jgi:hypothetical protein